ncbi:hypothetical protein HPB48_010710 [Haemaphysalis longicornis]|uniref:Uncharacterized protein n=1 Tax=Haemaphysalis longicornis TaxID=44386 RepID=A0A9J6FLS2_HAELO|nr:hypothetical protein HPB48_010710 [Haemaphysalis longicornis]
MEPELQARVNLQAQVLLNREGLYVIIVVLGASILGCVCVLTYSFLNYSKLKSNAAEVRNYIAAQAMVADQQRVKKLAVHSAGGAHVPADTKKAFPGQQPMERARNRGETLNETLAMAPRQGRCAKSCSWFTRTGTERRAAQCIDMTAVGK